MIPCAEVVGHQTASSNQGTTRFKLLAFTHTYFSPDVKVLSSATNILLNLCFIALNLDVFNYLFFKDLFVLTKHFYRIFMVK